jgi:hypothetical protein
MILKVLLQIAEVDNIAGGVVWRMKEAKATWVPSRMIRLTRVVRDRQTVRSAQGLDSRCLGTSFQGVGEDSGEGRDCLVFLAILSHWMLSSTHQTKYTRSRRGHEESHWISMSQV